VRRGVPRWKAFVFPQKKAASMKQAHLMDMLKKASESVCTSTTAVIS